MRGRTPPHVHTFKGVAQLYAHTFKGVDSGWLADAISLLNIFTFYGMEGPNTSCPHL